MSIDIPMSISWYFTRAEVVQTFIKISEDLGRFPRHISMIVARELSCITTRCSVRPADALAVHPHYIFAEKQIDSIPIYMSICGFVSTQHTAKQLKHVSFPKTSEHLT